MGICPFFITASAVEIIEKFGIIIWEPDLRFRDFTATSNAAVPLDTVTPYFFPINLENFFSKFITSFPSDEIQPDFMEFVTS